MIDLILGAILVALAIRGWWRGLVREALGLAVLVAGIFLSFRLSTPLGSVVEALAGTSPETSRLIAGIVLFVAIGVGAAVAAHVLHKGIRVVPGLPTANRAAGAGFSVVAVLAAATVAFSVLSVTSPPDYIAGQLEESSLAAYMTDPEAPPQHILGVLSGDRVIERLLTLQEIGGSEQVVYEGSSVAFEAIPRDDIDLDAKSRAEVLDLLNRERLAADAAPLVEHEPLQLLAEAHAVDLYTSGMLDENGSDGRGLSDRFADAGLPVVVSDQVVALAVSPEAAQTALFKRSGPRDVLVDPSYRRVGIAVAQGPLGVVLVEVVSN